MYNVLIADDEAVMRIAISNMLSSETSDFRLVAAVSNGAEALAYVRSNPVDIVITDLVMPVMDGLDLIQSLKDDGWGGVILVLSNYADFELARSALTRGANDYLLKLDIDGEMLEKQLTAATALIGEKSTSSEPHAHETTDIFYPCLLSLHNRAGKSETREPAQRALTVIKQMFAETDAAIEVIDAFRIFMQIPGHAHRNTYKWVMDKLHQTVRQTKIYLNLDARALLSKSTSSREQASDMLNVLEYAAGFIFSTKEQEVICLEDVSYADLPDGFDDYRKEVREAMLFIHFNFQHTITLDDVAKAVNLNRDYLCRLFKNETDLPMFRYLNNLRMQRAALLIDENPGRSYIRDIASAVGIDDQFYFTRVFKKYHGVSPSEYGKHSNHRKLEIEKQANFGKDRSQK